MSRSQSQASCPDEGLILDFVQGVLPEATLRPLEQHIARCEECRQLVSHLAQSSILSAPPASYTRPDPSFASLPHARTVASEPSPGRHDSRAPIAPVVPGDILAGKYKVERVLGAGGMGVVVQAMHLQLRQRVALKFLLPVAYEAPGAVARFLREARSAVQIRSEHVARVTDVGTLDNGAPYLVMELLEGTDLADALKQRGRAFEVDEAVEYVLQACEAIAEAHALGIVHRDLKPANLFLSERRDGSPLVKVLDFGISKVAEGGSVPVLTTREVMMGSPRYMSPEQMRSARDVDRRTDIWALGTILHELVVGAPAFDGDSMAALCSRIATEPPPRLRKLRGDAPVVLEAVILRCLEKDRERRIGSVAELASQLRPIAPARAQLSIDRIMRLGDGRDARRPTPPPPPVYAVTPPAAITGGSFGGTSPGPGRGRGAGVVGVVLGAIIALLLGVGVVLVARLPSARKPAVATSPSEPTAITSGTAADPIASVASVAALATETPAPLATLEPAPAVDAGGPRRATVTPRSAAVAPPATPPTTTPPTTQATTPARAPGSDTQNSGLVDRK
jgi:eukaryotic-like serine/threonine-protein kinase